MSPPTRRAPVRRAPAFAGEPLEPDRHGEVLAGLADIRDAIERTGGAPAAIGGMPTRHLLSALDPLVDLPGSEDHAWESILIENPNKFPVHVGFTAGAGAPSRAQRVVPAQMAVLIAVRFIVCSVGADPAAPALPGTVYVTRYDLPQAPIAYAFTTADLP